MKATTTKRTKRPRTAAKAKRERPITLREERDAAYDEVVRLSKENKWLTIDRDNARESLGYHDQHAARLASERDEAREQLTRARWVLSVLLSRVQLTSDDVRPGALCDCVDAVMGGREG